MPNTLSEQALGSPRQGCSVVKGGLPLADRSGERPYPGPLSRVVKQVVEFRRVVVEIVQLALIVRAQVELPPIGGDHRAL